MDPYEQVLNAVAHATGLDPLTIVGALPILVIALNLIGRAIPDDKEGFLKYVRMIAKIGGLYISNRVASGVSANSVVKVAAGLKKVEEVPELFERLADTSHGGALELDPRQQMTADEALADAGRRVDPLFPKVGRDPGTGKFVKLESPLWTGVVALGLILYLSSCAVPL